MSSNERASVKAWIDTALELRSREQRAEAIASLRPHRSKLNESGAGAGMLATLHFEVEDFASAAKWFGRAVELAPRSERASLGFFHSLWELGLKSEALNEMRRFLGTCDSREYTRLLTDLRRELLPDKTRRSRDAMKAGLPARLPVRERMAINTAERAGLAWRHKKRLMPVGKLELQNV